MTSHPQTHGASRLVAGALAAAVLACSHSPPANAPQTPAVAQEPETTAPLPADPRELASSLADEDRALLRAEGELLWQRWTSGSGAAPASATVGHERLYEKRSLEALRAAIAKSDPANRRALTLLFGSLAPQAIAREANAAEMTLEQARAQLAFAAPGDPKAERSERDLDRLLTDEPSAPKRAAIAEAEAAATAPLAALALARDRAEEEARAQLGLPDWSELIAVLHGRTPEQLAELAEATLVATQDAAARAVAAAAERNLGLTLDRLHRADLPRLVRVSEADGELLPGRGWENTRTTFAALGFDPLSMPPGAGKLRVDAEPAPVKAPRPLALLVDPPTDVRLSFKSAGGFDEQRALLHETARAVGGALIQTERWEMAQLGDGSGAEGIAWLAESLSGDPLWLRERTALRGEPLDDLVHTEATRRLLAVRRAAALVLFEVQRRAEPQTPEAQSALYRKLLGRATLAQHGEHEGGRWALEADGWMKAAVSLRAALLGASLALALEPAAATPTAPSASDPNLAPQLVGTQIVCTQTNSNPAPSAEPPPAGAAAARPCPPGGWWRSPASGELLRKLWAQGRALTAEEAASQAGAALSPAASADSASSARLSAAPLASFFERRLAYRAPDLRPVAPRPDYKFMQGDRGPRRKKHKKKSTK